MFHKVTIIGNPGADPELRYQPNGDAVATFSVATNRKWKNADGSLGEETVWFRVSAWRKLAETCHTYLKKGKLVYIEGRISYHCEARTEIFGPGFFCLMWSCPAMPVMPSHAPALQNSGGGGFSPPPLYQKQGFSPP